MALYPEDRITAAEALKHPYFDSVRMSFPDEEYIPYGNLSLRVCYPIGMSKSEQLWNKYRSDAYASLYSTIGFAHIQVQSMGRWNCNREITQAYVD